MLGATVDDRRIYKRATRKTPPRDTRIICPDAFHQYPGSEIGKIDVQHSVRH